MFFRSRIEMAVLHRFVLSAVVVLGALVIGGCEQGNDQAEKAKPGVIPPGAPRTSEEGLNIGKNAPDPTKAPKMPPPPPSAAAPAPAESK
jgi:hypothetical protein